MELHDILRVCLLALSTRYPAHSIDVHAFLLSTFAGEREGWQAEEVIRWLEALDPTLLERPATLRIDASICAIYLPEYSQQEPAFHLHCRGQIPACHTHEVARKSEQLQAIR
jgi:hypothetical protein